MNIGVIGAGAITSFLLKEVNKKSGNDLTVSSIFVRNREKYIGLEEQFNVEVFDNLDAFLTSEVDVVVEAANIEAVRNIIPQAIPKRDVMVISVGAFADMDFYKEMIALAENHGRKIYLPSGAIGGLDILQNANVTGGVTNVMLTTRKPAHTLIERDVVEAETIFEGTALEAIKQFPKNINVSIILSIAGIGVDRTDVKIIADPYIDNNIHTIDIQGDFGVASFSISNNPFDENPKTSHLAAMSVLGTLKRITTSIKIGV